MIKNICRSCDNEDLKEVISLGKSPLANNLVDNIEEFDENNDLYNLCLSYCEECSNCQLTEVINPDKMFKNYYYVSSTTKSFRGHFESVSLKYVDKFKLISTESLIVDIGSNDGIALIPFMKMGYNVLGIDPAENICKLAEENGVHTICSYFNDDIAEEYDSRADLVLASNVFAHSDKLKEMADCMLKLLGKNGTIIIEIQYLLNTLKDLTFDNIYHEHYNYWSLTSLVNFFNQFDAKIFRSEIINTHGGSLRIYIKKDKKVKIEHSVKKMLKDEEKFGIKKFKTYQDFGKKVYKIRENVIKNLKKLKENNNLVIGYGAPAKATTALNFFGVTKEIDFIVEDNKLKHNKFVPGVKIPIRKKSEIKNKKNTIVVLAWNFFEDIKKNNSKLSDNFVNIKDME